MITRTISQIIEPQTTIEGTGVYLLRPIAPRVSIELTYIKKYPPCRLMKELTGGYIL